MRTKSRTKTKPRTSVARTRSLTTRTTRRSKRSARTPKSGLAKVGNRWATSAPPTAEALPVSWTTRMTSATIETASPTNEIACPAQSCTKRTLPKRVFGVLATPAFQMVDLCRQQCYRIFSCNMRGASSEVRLLGVTRTSHGRGFCKFATRSQVNLWTERHRKGDAMKRRPELRTLSEDHHHGLVHARRLRRAAEGDEANSAEFVAKEFLEFWQKETAIHLRSYEPTRT